MAQIHCSSINGIYEINQMHQTNHKKVTFEFNPYQRMLDNRCICAPCKRVRIKWFEK
jgi:hypothetical protein